MLVPDQVHPGYRAGYVADPAPQPMGAGMQLADNGYQVTAVDGGLEALAALTHRLDRIDLLLTDVVMPQMQGKELAAKVLALHPGTRVVFMSGYTQGLFSAQGVLEPGIHLIEKPFSEATLLTKLHEVLSAPSLSLGACP